MKITFDRLSKISIAMRSINSNDKDGNPINDRLTWAIQRFQEKNESVFKKLTTEEVDIQREYASVDDKTKIFISDERGGMQFTKENLKKNNEALDKFRTSNSIDIQTYVCKNDVSRSNLLPLWIQKELDGIIIVMDPKIREFADEEEAETNVTSGTPNLDTTSESEK